MFLQITTSSTAFTTTPTTTTTTPPTTALGRVMMCVRARVVSKETPHSVTDVGVTVQGRSCGEMESPFAFELPKSNSKLLVVIYCCWWLLLVVVVVVVVIVVVV